MADVYIAFDREDEAELGAVAPIARALEAEGYAVCFLSGKPDSNEAAQANAAEMTAARCVVAVWSRASLGSDGLLQEALRARHEAKLISVTLEGVRPPASIAGVSHSLSSWSGELAHPAWRRLVAEVAKYAGAPGQARDPLVTRVPMPRPTLSIGEALAFEEDGSSRRRSASPRKRDARTLALYAAMGVASFSVLGAMGVSALRDKTAERVDPVVAATRAPDAAAEIAIRGPAAAPASEPAPQSEPDLWTNAASADVRTSYQAYLKAYPNGYHAQAARQRIRVLGTFRFPAEEQPARAPDLPFNGLAEAVVEVSADGEAVSGPDGKPTPSPTSEEDAAAATEPVPVAQVDEYCTDMSDGFQVRNISGRLELVSGHDVIQTFEDEALAARVLSVIRFYKMDRRCTLGGDEASPRYWLNSDGLPAGFKSEEDCIPINPSLFKTVKAHGGYLVMDGRNALWTFDTAEDAKHAIDVARMHAAAQQCYVGRPGPILTYLRR